VAAARRLRRGSSSFSQHCGVSCCARPHSYLDHGDSFDSFISRWDAKTLTPEYKQVPLKHGEVGQAFPHFIEIQDLFTATKESEVWRKFAETGEQDLDGFGGDDDDEFHAEEEEAVGLRTCGGRGGGGRGGGGRGGGGRGGGGRGGGGRGGGGQGGGGQGGGKGNGLRLRESERDCLHMLVHVHVLPPSGQRGRVR
jgi:hypothetical protein